MHTGDVRLSVLELNTTSSVTWLDANARARREWKPLREWQEFQSRFCEKQTKITFVIALNWRHFSEKPNACKRRELPMTLKKVFAFSRSRDLDFSPLSHPHMFDVWRWRCRRRKKNLRYSPTMERRQKSRSGSVCHGFKTWLNTIHLSSLFSHIWQSRGPVRELVLTSQIFNVAWMPEYCGIASLWATYYVIFYFCFDIMSKNRKSTWTYCLTAAKSARTQ